MALNLHEAAKLLEINKRSPDMVLSGFKALDDFTGGFQKGNLYIIAGKSSMCKSALVLNITRNVAVKQNKGVLYFTLEQSNIKVINRLIAAECDIELQKLNNSTLEEYEWVRLNHKVSRLSEAPIHLGDYKKLNINRIVKEARRMVEENGVELIVIDDIHRLAIADELKKGIATREQEASLNVRELKALALELNLPIIAISQLNKGTEARGGDRRPTLADLRDSGAIEDEADMLIFLYRPEYYGYIEDDWGNPTAGVVEVLMGKNRDGEVVNNSVKLKFTSKYMKFEEEVEKIDSFDFSSLPSTFDTDAPGSIRLDSRMNDGGKKKKGGLPSSNFEEPPF